MMFNYQPFEIGDHFTEYVGLYPFSKFLKMALNTINLKPSMWQCHVEKTSKVYFMT